MKKCPNCGKENIDEAKFCTWCGAELTIPKRKYDKSTKIALVILVVAICVCLGSIYMIFKSKKSGNNQNAELVQEDESVDSTVSVEKTISGEYLAPFMNSDSKWGYINQNGEVVIACKYDSADSFDENGCAVVGMKTDSDASEYYTIYGLINMEGEEIIPLDYSYINSSINWYCDNYGYRTITRLPYPFDYDNEYSGVIDNNGNIMISSEYSSISNIGDSGYYIACDAETGMYGIIDEDYEWVCGPDYSWIRTAWEKAMENVVKIEGGYVLIAGYDFQEGHGAEIINEYGEIIVPMEYYNIDDGVGMNRVIVEDSDGYYGAIDLHGEVQIPCQYDEMGNFFYGDETYAIKDGEVFLVDIYGNERYFTDLDITGQAASTLYYVRQNEKWNIINSEGEYILPEDEGYDRIDINEKYVSGSNEVGNGILVSRDGKTISTEYQEYITFDRVPEIIVGYENKYGVLDAEGKRIIPCEYDDWDISGDGVYISVRRENESEDYMECTLFDSNGNVIKEFGNGIYNVGAFQKISDAA